LKRAGRVIVEDVEQSPIFSSRDLEVQRQVGVRAVMSTPLVSRSGELVGMLSTHFRKPWRPDERKLPILDLLAREAADIIQHEQAEAEIGRQAALLDLAHDNIFVVDREGRIRYWNAGAARSYGWSKEEALGKVSLDLLQTRFPEPRERILDRVFRSGHWEGELIHTTRTGQRIIVDSRWALQPGANADDFRILEINYDITRRKKLEQEREDDARRKDEFLAFLGHELRNPLAAIHTAGQVLSGSASPAMRARMEDTIARQTALMRRLVDDLLEHERITRGHIELKRERVDLAESLQRAVGAVQSNVAARNQTLRVRLPSQPVPFMADVARLDQILGNLLTNATKYTGVGGSIELSGAREERDVVIRCKDNGQGVPREYQQKIFEPFARGPKTALGYGEASVGLGLALVKQLTELHGGTVGVESAGTGLGSEFIVRLPFVAAADQAMPERPTVAGAPRRPRSVVIVEDNPSVGATLKAALEQAGHSVSLFVDGSSTLAGLSDLKPDALVIDVGLPGMDGYELAARLKQQKSTKDALRIAVSGFKRRKHALAAAFDHYFNKPVDVPELLALLDGR
jgi:two-component system CheB/CheR fusion protein